MKFVAGYLKKYKVESILAPLFKMLEATFELFVPLVMVSIINVGIAQRDVPYVLRMCGVLVCLSIIGFVVAITAQFFSAKAAVFTSAAIRDDVYKKIMSLSVSSQEQFGNEALTTRITNDINQIQNAINLVLRLLLRSPFIVFGAAVMAFVVDGVSALVFCVVIPVLSVVVFIIMRKTLPRYSRLLQMLEGVLHAVGENLEGARVLRAFSREDAERDSFKDKTKELYDLQISTGKISALLNPITYVAVNMGIVLVIWIGAMRVDAGIILRGEIVALVNYMSQILVELIKLANLIVVLMKAFPSSARVEEVMNLTSDERCHIEGKRVGEKPEEDILEIKDVSFTYPGSKENAIEHISVGVKAGSVLGIIGGTGSGKTTLLKLLNHSYDVSEGDILINGRNVNEISDSELVDLFGVVPQKAALFAGTIESNLRMKKENASDQELIDALTAAQAYDFVLQKEGVLMADVAQDGRNFSGGQRQRLTIARALVGEPKIVVLDDSASALDLVTESKLRGALLSLPWHPTLIMVSQRASSVKNADKIVVLEDGKCVGIGRHDELLENCSTYQEIYYAQYPREVSK